MLIDQAIITVRAGRGGNGAISFRREKYIPKGGPDGGDGGKGGDIILLASHNDSTLLDFAGRHHWKAEAGQSGGPKGMTGRGGKDLIIKLPVGTLIYDAGTALPYAKNEPDPEEELANLSDEEILDRLLADYDPSDEVNVTPTGSAQPVRQRAHPEATGESLRDEEGDDTPPPAKPAKPHPLSLPPDPEKLLVDLSEPGQRVVIARGGSGGRGNASFATATHQTPREHEPGELGDELNLRLELKLIADVGLVGKPNAGKSTLLKTVTEADPRTADYPFTTLEPNLGVASLTGERRIILADLPGLIERAAEGAGLGHRFLRHVERTRVLVHLLEPEPIDGSDPVENYRTIRKELAAYSSELADKPEIIAISKADLLGGTDDDSTTAAEMFQQELGKKVVVFSSVSRSGLTPLLEACWTLLDKPEEPAQSQWSV